MADEKNMDALEALSNLPKNVGKMLEDTAAEFNTNPLYGLSVLGLGAAGGLLGAGLGGPLGGAAGAALGTQLPMEISTLFYDLFPEEGKSSVQSAFEEIGRPFYTIEELQGMDPEQATRILADQERLLPSLVTGATDLGKGILSLGAMGIEGVGNIAEDVSQGDFLSALERPANALGYLGAKSLESAAATLLGRGTDPITSTLDLLPFTKYGVTGGLVDTALPFVGEGLAKRAASLIPYNLGDEAAKAARTASIGIAERFSPDVAQQMRLEQADYLSQLGKRSGLFNRLDPVEAIAKGSADELRTIRQQSAGTEYSLRNEAIQALEGTTPAEKQVLFRTATAPEGLQNKRFDAVSVQAEAKKMYDAIVQKQQRGESTKLEDDFAALLDKEYKSVDATGREIKVKGWESPPVLAFAKKAMDEAPSLRRQAAVLDKRQRDLTTEKGKHEAALMGEREKAAKLKEMAANAAVRRAVQASERVAQAQVKAAVLARSALAGIEEGLSKKELHKIKRNTIFSKYAVLSENVPASVMHKTVMDAVRNIERYDKGIIKDRKIRQLQAMADKIDKSFTIKKDISFKDLQDLEKTMGDLVQQYRKSMQEIPKENRGSLYESMRTRMVNTNRALQTVRRLRIDAESVAPSINRHEIMRLENSIYRREKAVDAIDRKLRNISERRKELDGIENIDLDDLAAKTVANTLAELQDLKGRGEGNILTLDGEGLTTSQGILRFNVGDIDLRKAMEEGRLKFDGPHASVLNQRFLPIYVQITEMSKLLAKHGLLKDDQLRATGGAYVRAFYDTKILKQFKQEEAAAAFDALLTEAAAKIKAGDVTAADKLFDAVDSLRTEIPQMPYSGTIKNQVLVNGKVDLAALMSAKDKYSKTIDQQIAKGRLDADRFIDTMSQQLADMGNMVGQMETMERIANDPVFRPLVMSEVDVLQYHKDRKITYSPQQVNDSTRANTIKLGGDTWIQVPHQNWGSTSVSKYGDLTGKWVRKELWDNIGEVSKINNEAMRKLLSVMKKNKVVRNPSSQFNIVTGNMVNLAMFEGAKGLAYLAEGYNAIRGKNYRTGLMDQLLREGLAYGASMDSVTLGATLLGKTNDMYDAVMKAAEGINPEAPLKEAVSNRFADLVVGILDRASGGFNLSEKIQQKIRPDKAPITMESLFATHEFAVRYAWAKAQYERAKKTGASDQEAARSAVQYAIKQQFDFSELPSWAQFLREAGLVAFIGYPVKATGMYVRGMADNPNLFKQFSTVGKYDYALSDEQEQKRRDAVASYAQGWTVPLYEQKDPDGVIRQRRLETRNMTPFNLFPFTGMEGVLQGRGTSEGQVTKIPVPVSFADTPFFEIANNRTVMGNKIYNEMTDDESTKMLKIAAHLTASLGPMWFSNLSQTVNKARNKELSTTRQLALTPQEAVARMFGIKIVPEDPIGQVREGMTDMTKTQQELRQELAAIAKASKFMTEEEKQAKMQEISQKIREEMKQSTERAKAHLGRKFQ